MATARIPLTCVLEKIKETVHVYGMNSTVDSLGIRKELHGGRVGQTKALLGSLLNANREAQAKRDTTERIMNDWFLICDHILDIHRERFLFGTPTALELEEHKTGVSECIESCRAMAAQFSVNDPPEIRKLADGLQIRITQLEDAYLTFHNSEVSEEDAKKILSRVFPE